jgi:hypothetical protein
VLARPAQVQIAIAQPGVLADGDMLVDLEGQRRRPVEHLQLGDGHLDLAGGQVRVRVAVGTGLDHPGDLNAELVAQIVGSRGGQDLVADDDLGQPGGVSKIDEGDTAVIASVSHPSSQGHLLADVAGSQGACLVGSQHERDPSIVGASHRRCGPSTQPIACAPTTG